MSQSPWSPLRVASSGGETPLPGRRGRYLVYLNPGIIPPINGRGRFVHFSWKDGSYALRDYIAGQERRQGPDLTVEQVWRAAQVRIPATGDPNKGGYFVPVENGQFWRDTLERLTADYHANRL